MDRLRDAEELVAAVDDLPLGLDAEIAEQRDVGREELGDAAAVRGGVDVEDPGTGERRGGGADALDRLVAGDLAVVVEVLLEKGDAFEHGIPRDWRRHPTLTPGSPRGWIPGQKSGRPRRGRSIYAPMIGTAVACPDKFRGSLTAAAAAAAMGAACGAPASTTCVELPLADGGEGTLDVILATRGGARRTARVTGPLGDPVDAEWAMLGDGTAIVEMARASGHALVDPARRDPLRGEHARDRRAHRRGAARRVRAT